MIKKIVLDNFMSHAHTVIEPAEGLTVLVGPNNCGKSAVVEALRAVCENTRSDFMVRHGAKEAVVTIEMEDGHVIAWHRRKKGAAYVIDGERNDRPDEESLEKVHRLLKLPRVRASESTDDFDVHFGDQKSPIFLLNETGSRAATFFASSSDAERLLQMQRIHRNRVSDDKKEEQRQTAVLAALDAKLATLSPLDEIAPQLAEVEARYTNLKQGEQAAEGLEGLQLRLSRARNRVSCHTAQKEAAASLLAPPMFKDEQAMGRLIARCREFQRRRDVATQQAAVLAAAKPPPSLADEAGLQQLCKRRRAIEKRIVQLSATTRQVEGLAQPPVMADPSALQQRIAALRRLIAVTDRAAARRDRLQHIAEPPAVVDVKPIDSLLSRLRSAQSSVAQRHAAVKLASDQLAQTERSIQKWAEQNPTCPLCNGTIDPTRLVAAAGEHAHG